MKATALSLPPTDPAGRLPASDHLIPGSAWLCLGAFLWALMESLGRLIPRGISPYQVVWTRYATHLLVMTWVLKPGLIRTRRPGMQVGRAMLMLVMPVCFVKAAARLPMREVWAAFWIAPLLLLGFATLLLRERPAGRQWLLALAGMVGGLLITHPGLDTLRPALIFALGMAGCFSLYLTLTREMRDEPIFTNLFYTAFCVFCMMSLHMPRVWRWPSPAGWLDMVAIGIIGYFSLFSFEKALERAPLTELAPHLYTQLAWTVILAWILYHDKIGAVSFTGTFLIFGLSIYAWIGKKISRGSRNPIPGTLAQPTPERAE